MGRVSAEFSIADVRPAGAAFGPARAGRHQTSAMNQLSRLCRGLVVSSLVTVMSGAAAPDPFPGVDAKWRYHQSPHFELYSRNSDADSRLLLHNLEKVRAIFLDNFKLKPRRPVPLTVFFFSRDKFFESYVTEEARKLENIAAFYRPDPDRGILLMAPLPSFEAAQPLAFGSYTYHLFRLIDERPPLWFVMGVAELFRNIELNASNTGFGKPDPGQVRRLQTATLLPADALLFADHGAELYRSNRTHQLFRDQSWALLHYLYFGQHNLPRDKIDAFIRFVLAESKDAAAARLREVVDATLGLSYAQLNGALGRYVSSGRYGWSKLPVPEVVATKSYTHRPVPLEEIRLRLAELALRTHDSAQARLALLHAAGQPGADARLHEVLGAADYRAREPDRAAERWARAVEAGTDNAAIFHELGLLEGRSLLQRFDLDYQLPSDRAARLRELLQRSIKAAPDQAAAYETLAWVEAYSTDVNVANVNLIQRHFAALKDKKRTMLALALIRHRTQDDATAIHLLDELGKVQPGAWVADGAEQLRARIEGRRPERIAQPGAGKGRGPSIVVPPVKVDPRALKPPADK